MIDLSHFLSPPPGSWLQTKRKDSSAGVLPRPTVRAYSFTPAYCIRTSVFGYEIRGYSWQTNVRLGVDAFSKESESLLSMLEF